MEFVLHTLEMFQLPKDFNLILYVAGGFFFLWKLKNRINGLGLLMQVAMLLLEMSKHYNDTHQQAIKNQSATITEKIDRLYGKYGSLPYSDRGDEMTYTSRG